jgi:hypothetical protein
MTAAAQDHRRPVRVSWVASSMPMRVNRRSLRTVTDPATAAADAAEGILQLVFPKTL